MERLSTLVIQKLLDGFFLGLDVIDDARRRVDRLLGRPVEEPFEVTWPEPEAPPAAPPRGENAPAEVRDDKVAAESGPDDDAAPARRASPARPKAKVKTKAASKAKASKAASASRPKVPMEIEDLAEKVRAGSLAARQLGPDDELAGKRMIARIVYVLGAAEEEDLGGLTSTEIAHVLTLGLGIETFGTNISRAIRQGTGGLVEMKPAAPRDTNRYVLSDPGREAYRGYFARGA